MSLTTGNALQFWEQRYADGVTPWDRGQVNPAFNQWLRTGILSPGRILVPGCGRGHEVLALARNGFDVVAVDMSPLVVSELKQKLDAENQTAELIVADLLAWQPRQRFDFIYEQTCLCALVPAQWEQYAQRLLQWLRPGGLLLTLFMQSNKTDGPPFHCDPAAMRELFDSEHWDWPPQAPAEIPHSSGFHELAFVLMRR